MRGFQPAHKPAATRSQNFADGGVVNAITGALGLRKRTPEELRAADEQRMAKNREAAAAVAARAAAPAAAPAAPKTNAISDYAGMNAMKRREQMAGQDYANGGMVRGPGTGTSDDVPDTVPEGTYIMPADSTAQMGEETLEALGKKPMAPGEEAAEGESGGIPVNLSNGEFKLSPQQVHAVGVQALDQMKDATHTPVGARGFQPAAPQEASEPKMFFADGGAVQKAYDDWQQKKTPWYMPTPRGNMEERQAEAAYTDALKNQFTPQASAGPSAAPSVPAPKAPAAAPVAAGFQVGGGRGAVNPPLAKPSAPPPVPDPAATTPTATEIAPGVYQHGRGQYSDQAGGMGLPAGFTGQPSAGAMQAADALAQRSQNESMGRVQAQAAAADATQRTGPDALRARGFDALASRELGSTRRARIMLDAADRMESNANTRQSMQLDAQRLQLSDQHARAELGLKRDEFGLNKEVRGFQTRAAQRQEQLQERYRAAKTDQERAAIAREIRDLSGKEDPKWKVQVTPTTKNPDGSTSEGSVIRYNDHTGQVERVNLGPTNLPPIAQNAELQAIVKNANMSMADRKAAYAKRAAELGYGDVTK